MKSFITEYKTYNQADEKPLFSFMTTQPATKHGLHSCNITFNGFKKKKCSTEINKNIKSKTKTVIENYEWPTCPWWYGSIGQRLDLPQSCWLLNKLDCIENCCTVPRPK